jgi:hypothetical protein
MTKQTNKQMRRKAKIASKTASKTASQNAQLDRRSFMRLAGLGASVAGASIGLGAAEARASEAPPTGEHGGYRETEHVQTYYRMARF